MYLREDAVNWKWIYKIKRDCDVDISKFKARLVAKGFSQKYCTGYTLLLAIIVELDLDIDYMDVSTAFLNGVLKETVYMKHFVLKGNENVFIKTCHLWYETTFTS